MRLATLIALGLSVIIGQTSFGRLGTGLPRGTVGGGSCVITGSNITYTGSFRLPGPGTGHGQTSGFQFWSAGGGIAHGVAFDSAGNSGAGSLFIDSSIDARGWAVAELSIPGLIAGNSPSGGSTNVNSLNTAGWLQDFVDITNISGSIPTAYRMGGLIVSGSNLYGTLFGYFGPGQAVSVFRKGKTLATLDFFGFETLYDGNYSTATNLDVALGSLAGPLGDIPSNLQASLGGELLSGQFGLSIVGRNSFGPSAFAFHPSAIGSDSPSSDPTVASSSPVTTAKALLSYPGGPGAGHMTLGAWDDSALGGPINTHKEDPATRPYVSWIEQEASPIIEDNCFLSFTMYGVGHATSGATGLDVVTAHYGPTTTDWALNETYTGLDATGAPYSGGVVLSAGNANRLNSVAGTKVVTSDGTPFTAGNPGQVLYITGGTHFVAGNYTVAGFTNSSTVTLVSDPTDGTNASAGVGDIGADTGVYSYDPTVPDFSGHSPYGWPYAYRVIVYDVADLQAVAAGSKNAWDPLPLRKFDLPMPFDPRARAPVSIAYDRAHRDIYLFQPFSQDQDPTTAMPMVHVYHLSP